MFKVTVVDLDTGEALYDAAHEHAEIAKSDGFQRLDPDGDAGAQPPEIVSTGASIALIKLWSGERLGMKRFEDFVNFTDDTGGASDAPVTG